MPTRSRAVPAPRAALAGAALLLATACTGGTGGTHGAGARGVVPVALVNASSPVDDVFSAQFCGGALVGADTVVTAAHCLAGPRLPALAALVGADNLCRTAPVGGVRVPLARVRVDTGDEVALLRLAHPVGSAAFRHWAPARGLEALGWGRASYGGVRACGLTTVPLRRTLWSACASLAPDRPGVTYSAATMFCALPAPGARRNTCTGDSGGPVVDAAGRLVGIVLAGRGCGLDDPGIYAGTDGTGVTAATSPSLS